MSAVFVLGMAVAAVIFAHAAVINMSAAWTWKNVSLVYKGIHDPEAKALLAHREANPPWYERYYRWLERRVFRRRNGGAS